MATFGQTATLGNAFAIGLNYIATRFQAPANGTVTDIRAHLVKNFGGTVPAYAAMYTDNSGAPDALMFYTGSTTITGTPQFYTFSGGTTVTTRDIVAGQYYWLAVWTDDPGTCDFRYDTGLTDQFATTSNSPTFPTFNNPWGTPSYSSVETSIYATYTPASASNSTNFLQFF
jgi:hypothetical protein